MRHAMWLVPVALALTVSVASAESIIGIGMFGGVGMPNGDITDNNVKDTKTGINMGYRFPMAFSKMFSLEPFLDRTEGKPDEFYHGSLDGMDVTSYGINLGIGRLVRNHGGLHLTPFGGIMNGKLRRENAPCDDVFGWQAGLQVGLHASETTHWDLRGAYVNYGELAGEQGGRKYINISLGLTCVVAPR